MIQINIYVYIFFFTRLEMLSSNFRLKYRRNFFFVVPRHYRAIIKFLQRYLNWLHTFSVAGSNLRVNFMTHQSIF